jgi:serine/threonine protein kinase
MIGVVDSSNYPRITLNSKGKRLKPSSKSFPSSDPSFLDFVSKCLTWDPVVRLTPIEALAHSFILQEPGIVSLDSIDGDMVLLEDTDLPGM